MIDELALEARGPVVNVSLVPLEDRRFVLISTVHVDSFENELYSFLQLIPANR